MLAPPLIFLFSGADGPANSSTCCLDMVWPARLYFFILCLTMCQLQSVLMFSVPAKFSLLLNCRFSSCLKLSLAVVL